jgi:cytochrome b561
MNKYPLPMIFFHWLLAAVMIATLLIGWQLDNHEEWIGLHRSLGVMVLLIAVMRLFTRLMQRKAIPQSLNAAGSLQHGAERLVHIGLYACMIGVPLLGWLKTNASGHDVQLFGITLPALTMHNSTASHLFGQAHSLFASMFAILLALHVAGALVHRFAHKTSALQRMMP